MVRGVGQEDGGKVSLPGCAQVFEKLQAAHLWHFQAGNEQCGERETHAIPFEVSDDIAAVGKDFNAVMNAALFVMCPEGENVVRIVSRNYNRSHCSRRIAPSKPRYTKNSII